MSSRSQNAFLRGAMILALAGIISRAIGAVWRIFLPLVIEGAEGIGLFQRAYPLYSILLSLSGMGIPIAVSKLVAEGKATNDRAFVIRVFRLSLVLLAFIGAFFSVGLFASARFVAETITRDPRAYLSIAAISPAVFFVSVMAVFRGFFQGLQRMEPSGTSQVVEQIIRIITMFVLAWLLIPYGLEWGAAGAAFGAVTGGAASLVYLLIVYWRRAPSLLNQIPYAERSRDDGGFVELSRRIFALAIPISLAAAIPGVNQFIDMAVVPYRLEGLGYGVREVTTLFGYLTGFAAPLINLPTILTAALATSLVPAVSEALALNQGRLVRYRSSAAIRVAMLFSLPATAGLYLLSRGITVLLWDAPEAGPVLAAMAPALLFLSLQQTTSGVLQGLGRTEIPLRNLVYGSVVKLVTTWFMTSAYGIVGAAFSTVVGYLVSCTLNVTAVYRLTGSGIEWKDTVIKPAGAVVVMGLAVRLTHAHLSGYNSDAATLAAIGAGAAAYFLALAAAGGIRSSDLELVPGIGSRMARLLGRFGLIRG